MRNTKFSASGHRTSDNVWKSKEDGGAGELGLESSDKGKAQACCKGSPALDGR